MAEQTNTVLSLAANRKKYLLSKFDSSLRNYLVAEQVCRVDKTDNYKIENPYGSQPTTSVTHFTGTYATAAYTVTDDTLTVVDEFKCAEHIFDFEKVVFDFDIMANRLDEQFYSVANSIDNYVINVITEAATSAYSTPSGGFTTAANIQTIMGNLQAKVGGYEAAYKGTFLIIENTDLPGFIISGAASGFGFADNVLKDSFQNRFKYLGTDVYVVRTGLFASTTTGSEVYTNAGHRVFGVKGMATYAAPRGIQYEEKPVTLKTGMETVTYGYIGAKLWATKAALLVDITITA